MPRNVDIATFFSNRIYAPIRSPGISDNDAVFVVTNNCHHVQAAKLITGLSFVNGATFATVFGFAVTKGPNPNDTGTVLVE